MRSPEKDEKRSISQISIISQISALFRKLFTCQQKTKKKPNRFISYAAIEIKCPDSFKAKLFDDKSFSESESYSKTKNPESATVSSQNNLSSLIPALHQFKLTTAVSR